MQNLCWQNRVKHHSTKKIERWWLLFTFSYIEWTIYCKNCAPQMGKLILLCEWLLKSVVSFLHCQPIIALTTEHCHIPRFERKLAIELLIIPTLALFSPFLHLYFPCSYFDSSDIGQFCYRKGLSIVTWCSQIPNYLYDLLRHWCIYWYIYVFLFIYWGGMWTIIFVDWDDNTENIHYLIRR